MLPIFMFSFNVDIYSWTYSFVCGISGLATLSDILYKPIPAIESPTSNIGFYQLMAKLVQMALKGLFSLIA